MAISRDEYDEHMDQLVLRMSEVVDGEETADVAFACCAIIGFALNQQPPERRAGLQTIVYDFLAKQIGQYR